jgi:hypothetical protein
MAKYARAESGTAGIGILIARVLVRRSYTVVEIQRSRKAGSAYGEEARCLLDMFGEAV